MQLNLGVELNYELSKDNRVHIVRQQVQKTPISLKTVKVKKVKYGSSTIVAVSGRIGRMGLKWSEVWRTFQC